MAFSSAIVDKEEILQFTKKVISDEEDSSVPTIDHTSTVNGFIKYLIEKEHRENVLNGKTQFYGIVFRTPGLYGVSNLTPENLISSTESDRTYIYKVFVPEIDVLLELPNTFDDTPQDRAKIDLYGDFTSPDFLSLKLGDKVLITYGDIKRYKQGKIIEKVAGSNTLNKQVSQPSSQVFKQKLQKPVSIPATEDFLSTDDAYRNNKNLGRIKIKNINLHNGKMVTLESNAADKFLQMRDAAKSDGITLHANSGFRGYQEQKQLYDKYIQYKNYGGPKANLASSPDKAPSAGHRAGDAVDIQTGGFDTKTYLWLYQNAPKYDFYNNGRFFEQKESWHFQYAPAGSQAISMETVADSKKYHVSGEVYKPESDKVATKVNAKKTGQDA